MPDVEIADRRMHYERRGGGAPLLLIQGMSGHHRIWGEPFLAALGEDFDVVAYDHRGIGESTDVPGPFTIADLAADAVSLLDGLGWAAAHVLGISMGGMVAQELALRHPDRVRSLVLGCTYAGGRGSSLESPAAMAMLQAMRSGDAERAIRTSYEGNLSAGFRSDESRYPLFRQTSLSVRVPGQVVLRQAKAIAGHDTSARLPGLRSRTLVVHGTGDVLLAFSNATQVASLIPGARLEPLDGAGHLFWWERPERVAALVREHCR